MRRRVHLMVIVWLDFAFFIQETRTFANVKVKNNAAFRTVFMPVQFDLMFALTSMLQKWLLSFSALPVSIFMFLFGRKIPGPY